MSKMDGQSEREEGEGRAIGPDRTIGRCLASLVATFRSDAVHGPTKTEPNPPPQPSSRSTASQERFLQLFLSSEREVYRYIAAIAPARGDAEEIMQQTAVELWRKLDQFDLTQPFTPLACRFALNVAKQWLARKRRWQGVIAGDLADRIVDRRAEMLPRLDARLEYLEVCLEKLPLEQRRLIDGYYFRHGSIDAVAAEAKRSVAAAYKALQRIRRVLEECIERAERAEAGG
jgi:RNA polymerase sigma-70 factor (ECF subfamily)